MRKHKRLLLSILVLLVLLYGVTGIGGWISHSLAMKAEAERRYHDAQLRNEEYAAASPQLGEDLPVYLRLHKGGPDSGVSWCVPILPGVLLADSYYSVGPLYAKGGIKVVVWYGFGSVEVCTLLGWIT
jgi:hypothetical protein